MAEFLLHSARNICVNGNQFSWSLLYVFILMVCALTYVVYVVAPWMDANEVVQFASVVSEQVNQSISHSSLRELWVEKKRKKEGLRTLSAHTK